jgi:3-methyladenine DNA glycosylase Tag
MSNLNRGHSIDDSYQVSLVAMFVNHRDEMSNLHRGHSIDASYQVSVHLAKQFQRRRFKKISQSETRIAMFGNGS